jgi:hypothetical protein
LLGELGGPWPWRLNPENIEKVYIMKIVALIMLSLTLLGGGIARLVLAFQTSMSIPFEKSLSRTDLVIIAFVNIVSAIAGIVCLLMGMFTPFYILIAVFLITSLVEILIRLKAGVSRRPKSR